MTLNKWIKNRIFAIAILLSIIFSSGYSSYAVTVFANQNDYAHTESIKQEAKRVKSECLCSEKNAQIQIKRTVDGTSKEAKSRNRHQQPFIYGAIFSHNLFPGGVSVKSVAGLYTYNKRKNYNIVYIHNQDGKKRVLTIT